MSKEVLALGVSAKKLNELEPEQKADVERFVQEADFQGWGRRMLRNYTYRAIEILRHTGKTFGTMQTDEIKRWLATKTLASRPGVLAQIRAIFKLINGGQIPEALECIKVKPYNNSLPIESLDDLISREELKKMMDACVNPKHKALLYVLFDSGARIGELVRLRVKDLLFDDKGIRVLLKGKTGKRAIRLTMCQSPIRKWLEAHPYGDDKEAFLFPVKRQDGSICHLTEEGARMVTKRAGERIGLKKRIHPHLFRHSRLTELAATLPDYLMKKFAGWTMNSGMPSKYIHLDGTYLDKALLDAEGKEEVKEDSVFTSDLDAEVIGIIKRMLNDKQFRARFSLRMTEAFSEF